MRESDSAEFSDSRAIPHNLHGVWDHEKDLCALGGWKDHNTILMCYHQPDPEAMRLALGNRGTLRNRRLTSRPRNAKAHPFFRRGHGVRGSEIGQGSRVLPPSN